MTDGSNMSRLVYLDHLLGLRAWGLIVYGALPANLALFGIVSVKIGEIENRLLFLLLATLLPLGVTFLLVRNRQQEWYLTNDYINFRSFTITFLIVLVASLISGISGVIDGKYILKEGETSRQVLLSAIAESYLFGIGSLVLSSTLFMTIITRGADLPGLPNSDFVDVLGKIRQKLKQLQANSIWTSYKPPDEVNLAILVKELQNEINQLSNMPGHKLALHSIWPIQSSVKHFNQTLRNIQNANSDGLKISLWNIYFEKQDNLNQALLERREDDIEKYSAIHLLQLFKLGD